MMGDLSRLPIEDETLPEGWNRAVQAVKKSGKLLIVPRTAEGVSRVLVQLEGCDACPKIETTLYSYQRQSWTGSNRGPRGILNSEGASRAKERLANLHAKTLGKLSPRHAGYYYALTPKVVDKLLEDSGAIVLGRSGEDDVVSLCLNRRQSNMKIFAEKLSADAPKKVSRAKIAEIGGFLPVTKQMLPEGLDRTQLLAQVMCDLQLICAEQKTELALAIVHTKNRAMEALISHLAGLNPGTVLNLGETESPKDGSPCIMYGFDLVGKYSALEQA